MSPIVRLGAAIGGIVAALVQPTGTARLHAQQDYSSELPRIAPTEPAETLKHFAVAEGFEIQLVAAEPLVATPVAIEWDAKGGLFVCEMRGYSEDRDDKLSRVRYLTDNDQDGVYDDAVVFVDGLLWPTAIFPFDGGLFVADAPDLFYCRDTDGDGVADIKEVVLTGFGTSNVQGLVNSFRWGLDNRIHVACSSVGGEIHRPGDPEHAINVRGRDLSFDPRTFDLELTSGGAQHGMCFDDWGHKFVSSNSDHIQQVMYEDRYVGRNPWFSPAGARVSIAADGPQAEVYRTSPVEPWRIVRTRLRVGGLVPGPIEGGGRAAGYFTGATGITIYRGDNWPQASKGLAIVGDVGSNLIHRKRLESDGLQMTAYRIDRDSEFVTSSDIWFRPAQFANAPDGSLHVIDVCREVIEHPKSLPEEIKQHLDLTSGRDRGRIYRIVATGSSHRPTPNLDQADSAQLVALLDHPNAWHRETAARLLYERQDPTIVADLEKAARDASTPQGRLHALYALQGMRGLNPAVVDGALRDRHPQLRRHALRLCETIPLNDSLKASIAELADDPSIEVRYQLAFSLGSIDHPDRMSLLAKLIRRDTASRWVRLAVHSSLAQGAGEMFAQLATDQAFRSDAAGTFLSELATQLRKQRDAQQMQLALHAVASLAEADPLFALPIAGQLVDAQATPSEASAALGQVVAKLVRSSAEIAIDPERDAGSRVRAAQALALGQWSDVQSSLVTLIDSRQPPELQKAALETAGKFANAELAGPILNRWQTLSPSLRQTAIEVLFARPDRTEQLFQAITDGRIPLSDLPRDRLTITANSRDPQVKSQALEFLRQTAGPERQEIITKYAAALERQGDLERGRQVFVKHCSGCHRVEDKGHEIGPNLATIKTRGPESILTNVLDPNAEVNPQYVNYVLLTVDGRTMTGMIAAENANSITLRRAESATDNVLRSDIERLQSTGKSIMPEGLEESIDLQAMADLIHYLMQVD